MTFGARPFGSRSFGDSAPTGDGIAILDGATALAIESSVVVLAAAAMPFNGDLPVSGSVIALVSGGLAGAAVPVVPSVVAPGGPAAGQPAYPAEVVVPPFAYTYRNEFRGHALTDQERAQRDRELEDFLADDLPELEWTYPGYLSVKTSPPWFVRRTHRLLGWVFMLGTPGTSDPTILQILVNDVPVLYVPIPAGETMVQAVNVVEVVPHVDVVKLEIVSTDVDAADLTVQAERRQVWRQYASNFN